MISTENNKPILNGLVLAGGKGSRLGQDKSILCWHGVSQERYMATVLENFCEQVFISKKETKNCGYPVILDMEGINGPIAGILAAFKKYPDKAWLVVACDLPLLNKEAIENLIAARNINCKATAYESPRDGSPEPLAAIYEPSILPWLEVQFAAGINCPRKMLMTTDTKIIKPSDPDYLKNVNTPEDREMVIKILEKNSLYGA